MKTPPATSPKCHGAPPQPALLKLCLTMLLVVAAVGCATSNHAVPTVSSSAAAFGSSNVARICVMRAPSSIGKMKTWDFYDNQEQVTAFPETSSSVQFRTKIGSLSPGSHILYERPAGRTMIRVFERGPSVDLTTEAGKTYYVQLKLTALTANLSLLGEADGAAALRVSKPAVQVDESSGGWEAIVLKDEGAYSAQNPYGLRAFIPIQELPSVCRSNAAPSGFRTMKGVSGYRVIVTPKSGGAQQTYYTQRITSVSPQMVYRAGDPNKTGKYTVTEFSFVPMFDAAVRFSVSTIQSGLSLTTLGANGAYIKPPAEFEGTQVFEDGRSVDVRVRVEAGLPADQFQQAVADWIGRRSKEPK